MKAYHSLLPLPPSPTPTLPLLPVSLCAQSHLDGLAEEEFSTHKKALELKRLEKPKTLGEECQKYWTEITTGMYCFNRGEVIVVIL